MTPSQLTAAVILALFNAALGWSLYRMNRSQDAKDARSGRLEDRVSAIELSIAGDLMTKDDMALVISRLDKMDDSLDKLKDMVARMEEREKVRHERP